MNREILFRGKLVAGGEWAYGNLVVKSNGVAIITPDDTPIGKYGVVDRATVGQYTGLKDKNDKKIFEGDIVKVENPKPFKPYIRSVVYVETSFVWGDYVLGEFAHPEELEVIGNIYENPELLKEPTP